MYLFIEKKKKKNTSEKDLRKRLNQLSMPAKKEFDEIDYKLDPTLRFSTFSEAKELTFKPNIGNNKAKKTNYDDDEKDSKRQDDLLRFVRRQEDRERSKRDELDYEIGKLTLFFILLLTYS